LLRRGWTPRLQPTLPGNSDDSTTIVHLLFSSLPYVLNGYTVRSQALLYSQLQIGLPIMVFSRPGFPWDMPPFAQLSAAEVPAVEAVEGVIYRRIADPKRGWSRGPLHRYLDRYAARLSHIVEEVRPAVLHAASNFVNGCVAGAVGRAYGIPVVYEVRGFWELTRASLDPAFKKSLLFRCHHRLETQALAMADAVVCISEGLKREIVRRGIEEEKVQVIPNGVERRTLIPQPRDPTLVAALGLAGKIVVGYIGSLEAYEGVDILLRACDSLQQRRLPLKTIIVGDGAVRDKLEALAKELNLGEAVHFTGRVPQAEALRYYSIIDICPFPRKNLEICHLVTPLKPYEAMAMAKAVIVSDVAALQEMVKEGRTGLVCRADDVKSLAEGIELLIKDQELRARLGQEGRAWVSAYRDWETLAQSYLRVYATLNTL